MIRGASSSLTGMAFQRLLAQAVVSDLEVAEQWYATLLGGSPQARPMDGLLEWHLAGTFGVQVWLDPTRAGNSAMVIEDSDLDGLADRLAVDGLEHGGPQPGGGGRVLVLADPDGNQVVISGE